MTDLRVNGTKVHVEGCLWAPRRLGRSWLGSGTRTREDVRKAMQRTGLTACPDCRPLDSLSTTRTEGASRG